MIACPRCRSGLVGSTPSLTRSRRPSASFACSSASLMIWAAPCFRMERASSGCINSARRGCSRKLLTLVQQLAHLLDRERFVLGAQRFLAFALLEERPVAGVLANRCGLAALRRDTRACGRRWCHDQAIVFRRQGPR